MTALRVARYRVTRDTPDGGDVDLDAEVITAPDGHRVTEAETEDFTARRAGRPSLGGAHANSPVVAVRVPAELRARAEAQASREGITLSEFTRRALLARIAGGGARGA